MTPKRRHQLIILLRFAGFYAVLGLIYSIVEYGVLGDAPVYPSTQNIYRFEEQIIFTILGGAFLGVGIGYFEVFLFKGLFARRSFGYKILLKTMVYSLLIILMVILLALIIRIFSNRERSEIFSGLLRFVTNFAFLSVFIYIGMMMIISLFVYEISKNLGINVFYNFITGKYHKPRIENRIFMFMDMKSSTTIAEELGHVKYYELLNRCYTDMSDSIINSKGEIYQYVGDEIIISWSIHDGVENFNCLRCFYDIQEVLTDLRETYITKFGIAPTFKAAVHSGGVTTGEIGELKKEIVYTGDVLNTTSRIQELCNVHNAQLLATQHVLELFKETPPYPYKKIGELELRGKKTGVVIHRFD